MDILGISYTTAWIASLVPNPSLFPCQLRYEHLIDTL